MGVRRGGRPLWPPPPWWRTTCDARPTGDDAIGPKGGTAAHAADDTAPATQGIAVVIVHAHHAPGARDTARHPRGSDVATRSGGRLISVNALCPSLPTTGRGGEGALGRRRRRCGGAGDGRGRRRGRCRRCNFCPLRPHPPRQRARRGSRPTFVVVIQTHHAAGVRKATIRRRCGNVAARNGNQFIAGSGVVRHPLSNNSRVGDGTCDGHRHAHPHANNATAVGRRPAAPALVSDARRARHRYTRTKTPRVGATPHPPPRRRWPRHHPPRGGGVAIVAVAGRRSCGCSFHRRHRRH